MNRNTAVTRTFSAGNCNFNSVSRTFSAPEDARLHSARRHSSAGVRALKWATASARSFGSSFGLDNRASKDNLFNIVVTPDTIPQFTIPSLAVQDGLRFCGKDRENQCEGGSREAVEFTRGNAKDQMESLPCRLMSTSLSSSSSSSSASSSSGFGSSPPPERRAHRSVSDPTSNRFPHNWHESCALLAGQDFPDPVTRAAFSLPHLSKVTTPYGFVTLSQSPQRANEEALFFQTGPRRCVTGQEGVPCPSKRSASQTGPVHLPASTSRSVQLVRQPSSHDHRIPETGRGKQNALVSVRHPKSKFWGVLRKHFSNRPDLDRGRSLCD